MWCPVKKRFLECEIHDLALFRCKRRCWQRKSGKDKIFGDEYTERCFKCINEGRYRKTKITEKKIKHFRI